MNDDRLFERIRKNARRLVEEKFAWQKGVEIMEGVLEKMMEKNPSAKN